MLFRSILHALGRIGSSLLRDGLGVDEIGARLAPLSAMDWRRENAGLWEGRALLGGRVSKAEQNVTLTTNVLKRAVGLDEPLQIDFMKAILRKVMAFCS